MRNWVVDAVQQMGVWGVGLLMLLENVFPPLPSEVIMPLAGYLSSQGQMSFWAAVAAGTVGSALGATLWYVAGRAISREGFRKWVDDHGAFLAMSCDDLDRAEGWFERHGKASIFFGRLAPVVRTLISVPAGFTRISLPLFLLLTALGTAIWTAALAYAGRFLGQQFHQVQSYIGPVTWVIIGAAVIWYVVRVVRLKRSGRASFFESG